MTDTGQKALERKGDYDTLERGRTRWRDSEAGLVS